MIGEEWKAVKEQVELIATEVVEWDRTKDVIYSLQQRNLLVPANVGHLMSLNTRKEQVRRLVDILAAAGGDDGRGDSLSIFFEILQEQGMENLVKHLDPGGTHSNTFSPDTSAFSALRLTPYQHPPQHWRREGEGITAPTSQPKPHPPLPQPGQDITNNNQNDNSSTNNNDNMTVTDTCPSPLTPDSPRVPLKISVVPCREIGGRQFLTTEVYRNESAPRGYVFLANYKDFADGQHECRLGSEIDTKNLVQLFSQMGYKISYHSNMSKWDTIQKLREFRNKEEHSKVDSCVVVFMSHGRDATSFFTSDNQHLTVNEVVERFNNRECPLLKGKPKIFIFQFCRGSGPDVGVDSAPRNVSYPKGLNVVTDSSGFGETLPERDPTYTDMYIVYSTVGGFVSFRHPESGSWLVEAICKVFMMDACSVELEHLMKKVSRLVRANFSTEGSKQACEFVQKAFDRHFFFNPKPIIYPSILNPQPLGDVPLRCHPAHHRRRVRTSSPSTKPKPGYEGGARSRHFSGESSSSEKCFDNLDVLDHAQAQALHPRIQSLSASQRRMSVPESSVQTCGMAFGRSLSELNSEGSSPEPSEASELGTASWASLEGLSPLENPRQQWRNIDNSLIGACGGDSRELDPDTMMKEASPVHSQDEGFPLIHSQSNLEAIQPCDIGGVTGVGPELRAVEDMRMSFKRQLSMPSNNETLQKVNDVRRYLMLNESDEALLHPLKRIESFINKKKNEGKRRKKDEPSSLEY